MALVSCWPGAACFALPLCWPGAQSFAELELVDFVVVESVLLSVVGIVVVVVELPLVVEEPLDDVPVVPARARPVERAIMAVPIRRRFILHLLSKCPFDPITWARRISSHPLIV